MFSAELLAHTVISQIHDGDGQMYLHLEKGRLYCLAGYEEIKKASMRGRESEEYYFNLLNFQSDTSFKLFGD